MDRRRKLSPLEKEVVHHATFANHRAETFFGRGELKTAAVALLTDTENSVKVIYGKSGTGLYIIVMHLQ